MIGLLAVLVDGMSCRDFWLDFDFDLNSLNKFLGLDTFAISSGFKLHSSVLLRHLSKRRRDCGVSLLRGEVRDDVSQPSREYGDLFRRSSVVDLSSACRLRHDRVDGVSSCLHSGVFSRL